MDFILKKFEIHGINGIANVSLTIDRDEGDEDHTFELRLENTEDNEFLNAVQLYITKKLGGI